ncbi:palladin isoform X1 [Gallus gallus]|uniref:palladin isoform X1 n=3 Tax=Gallus gallus TaxID=9031 RepID=UPI001AE137B0|nr:palladin isoform X1 [Gallus gallus]XP_040527762.1 palladin isoform X1 [Gallus gallus]XP_046772892.1 palladin isoform X1 [Gallus gallus]
MQDRSCGQSLPLSLMQKETYCAERGIKKGHPKKMSEASSRHDFFYGSLSGIQNGEFSNELSAFLTQEEICKSLDIARESIANSMKEDQNIAPELTHFNTSSASEHASFQDAKLHEQDALQRSQASSLTSSSASHIPPVNQKEQFTSPKMASGFVTVSRKQESTSPLLAASPSFIRSLKHSGKRASGVPTTKSESASQGEVPFRNKLCDKAATFIEELSSIFREAAKTRGRSPDGDSSPDSGYLSPKKKQSTLSTSKNKDFNKPHQETEPGPKLSGVDFNGEPCSEKESITQSEMVLCHPFINAEDNQSSPPQFTQKLRSQEVAEGNKVLLECRVAGNPVPDVRWFCEGKELQNSPDIQIHSGSGGLHSLIIAEAFEDDTGRYTCLASNSLGSDSTSAEIFIEGASSTDSESESLIFKSKSGAMPQAQKKTTSVSLTIGSSSPKSGVTTAVIQPISVPSQQVQSPTSYLHHLDGSKPINSALIFTKELQNSTASEGQVVVLECRVRGPPPIHVKWFRQGIEIQDSPDFRILQKKPRSATEPEEICTLVIAETFPEDSGLFTCTATNEYGSVTSSAQLTVCSANSENSSHESLTRKSSSDDFHHFPPLPPTEFSSLELSPTKHMETHQINNTELRSGVTALQLDLSSSEEKTNGIHPIHGVNGMINSKPNGDKPISSPAVLLSPAKEPPPVLAKPKLDPIKIQQLQNQIRLEQESGQWYRHQQQSEHRQHTPSSPSFPPPPSFQELESSQSIVSPVPMSILNSHTSPSMQSSSSFNYARPKQFIAAQNISPASGYVTPSSGSSTSSLPSPMSPTASQKQFGRVPVPPFSQQFAPEGEYGWSPSSPSPPPPPPPVFSPTTTYPVCDSFPLPPPPPPPLPSLSSPSHSLSPTPRFPNSGQSPAAFLSSMLPSQPPPVSVNALGLPKGVMPPGFPKKTGRTARIASDEEIQGSKDAVIQDLERKLRFKEDLLNNGQPRLTYEEKMARRLLGADSAATVFNIQEPEEEPAIQEVCPTDASVVSPMDIQKEYKVSSFEQRLISEIEYRLERSPVEESDDEVQHGDEPVDNSASPYFEIKLKHYKVFEGMPVTFTCKVTGNPKPKIYWFKDGKQISKRSDHYRIQREPDGTCSLHTAASTLDDDGNYTIMAANPQGRISCTGRLMVQAVNQRGRSPWTPPGQPHIRRPRSRSRDSGDENEPIQERFFRPHFLQAPGDLTVQEGKLCRMDCKVSGLPTPDLSWQLNGRPIRPDSSHKMLVRENGVHSLIIEPVTARDAGIYTCVASNRAGENTFSLELIVAAKEVHKAPVFIEKLQNTGVTEGFPVRLECRISGEPSPQIFWKKENESITHNTDRVSMHQDNYGYICLLIQGATKEDAGWYTVSAKNEAGIVSCTARLDVYTQWQQPPQTTKPKKVRPSTSRYAALCDQGLDIKAAFQPEANPVHLTMQSGLVESDDL